jgi:hypothetical protein
VTDDTILQRRKLLECYEEYAEYLTLRKDQKNEATLSESMGDVYASIHDWDNAITRYEYAEIFFH